MKVLVSRLRYGDSDGKTVPREDATHVDLTFHPVFEGSPENRIFWEATPAGRMEFEIHNVSAVPEGLKEGDEFYVDFTKAGEQAENLLGEDEGVDLDPAAKTLHNTAESQAKDSVSDLRVSGNTDMFQLLCKASSQEEGWMKSTKAMDIPGVGVIVQVTTQQDDHVAEALTFVSGAKVASDLNGGFKLAKR